MNSSPKSKLVILQKLLIWYYVAPFTYVFRMNRDTACMILANWCFSFNNCVICCSVLLDTMPDNVRCMKLGCIVTYIRFSESVGEWLSQFKMYERLHVNYLY